MPQVGIINPSEFAPGNSIEAVIWVAVGGRGTLIGAALGAVVVNYGKTTFTSGVLAPYWLFVLGSLFVLVTLLLPRGIVGTVRHFWGRYRERKEREAGDMRCALHGSHHALKVPTMPLGNSSVTRMNNAPSMNSQYGASGPEVK